MKTLFLLILLTVSVSAFGQTCTLPEKVSKAKGFAIHVKSQELNNGYMRYIITFKTPATSNHVLESNEIECEGWMPKGAAINRIEVVGVKGLEGMADEVKWNCNTKDCSWEGGDPGCVVVILKKENKNSAIPATVVIRGLGSLYGISKWYDCTLELKL